MRAGVYPKDVEIVRDAEISPDGLYRYKLTRRWGPSHHTARFIMLNPSTADALVDDPTIRRCVGFARALGCDALTVLNLYAFRATKPADLWRAADPVGPAADDVLVDELLLDEYGDHTVVAWGANARADRVAQVVEIAEACSVPLVALGVTKDGQPRHPLYLPADSQPVPWAAPVPV